MRAEFVRQCRQDRHVAISPPFGVDEAQLRGIAIQQEILDADVHTFIHACPGLEQRFEHEAVGAPIAIGGLNQAFDFAGLQAGDCSVPRARWLKRQPTTDPLHDVFGLIVVEMVLAPEAKGVLHDVVEGLRLCWLTTQLALW